MATNPISRKICALSDSSSYRRAHGKPVKMASAMRRILASVGVESSVVEKFEAQDITPDVVQTLSDTQMFELGVTTLGKRQLIRSLCKESVAGNGKQLAF